MSITIPDNYRPAPGLLNGRVILITGAGDGIGRAAAATFAAHGATLVLLGRTRKKLETLHDEIVATGGKAPALALVDLAKAQGPAYFDLVEQIRSLHGRLDGLLHNAAMAGTRAPIEHHDIGNWVEIMHVNLTAPFILTKLLLPLLRKSADASVVFTSSNSGRRGKAFAGAYGVSKFGIEGLSQILAAELEGSTGIRVNCVNPVRARTAMRRSAYPAEDPVTLPTPSSLMSAYLYLIGPDGTGVTGKSLDCRSDFQGVSSASGPLPRKAHQSHPG